MLWQNHGGNAISTHRYQNQTDGISTSIRTKIVWKNNEGELSFFLCYTYVNVFNSPNILQMSEGHVALLIHGMFNASIRGDEMSKKYSYNQDTSTW